MTRSQHPLVRIAARTLVVAATSALVACQSAEPVPMTEGQALYEANCMECHGASGLGDGTLAASLPVQPPSLLDHLGHHAEDQLIRIIRTGVPPAMPPAPLEEREVRLVIEHAWTLVPDSLVEGLREMQRMAEMGMDMGMDMGMGGGMDMGMDTAAATPATGSDSVGTVMPMDTGRVR